VRVSVVIPCYNGARFLRESLESVRAQTRPPEQVIVVDDGSTDDSAEIAASTPGVELIRQANLGACLARNAGLARATGELLVFHDADDRLLPHALERGDPERRELGDPVGTALGQMRQMHQQEPRVAFGGVARERAEDRLVDLLRLRFTHRLAGHRAGREARDQRARELDQPQPFEQREILGQHRQQIRRARNRHVRRDQLAVDQAEHGLSVAQHVVVPHAQQIVVDEREHEHVLIDHAAVAQIPQVALVDPVARLTHVGHLEPRAEPLERGRPRVRVPYAVAERERIAERDHARLVGRNRSLELGRVAEAARVRAHVEPGSEHVPGDASLATRPAELGIVDGVAALGQRPPVAHPDRPDEEGQARDPLEKHEDEPRRQKPLEHAGWRRTGHVVPTRGEPVADSRAGISPLLMASKVAEPMREPSRRSADPRCGATRTP